MIFIFLSDRTHAQNIDYQCATSSTNNESQTPGVNTDCIDVEEIMKELEGGDFCRLIYINVNVHFFVSDDCSGDLIVPPNTSPSEANKIAEDLINYGNWSLYQNAIQKNQPGSKKLCNPFQYILKGVYIHCEDDNIDALYNLNSLKKKFGVNVDSELQLFISPCSECTGVARFEGSVMNVDWFSGGNLNHEFGHLMGLDHSWNRDGIDDTPPIQFNIDRNCDGVLSYGAREIGEQCWGKVNPNEPLNEHNDRIGSIWKSDIKKWINNVHDCHEQSPCSPDPCCLDEYQNNNVMAYNADQNSFTYLQIKAMLIHLNAYKCDFINSIKTDRSCQPVNAFITAQLPGTDNPNACKICFDLTASFGEGKYKIKLYKIENGIDVLVQDRPWVFEKASQICFTILSKVLSGGRTILPNTRYKLELIVGSTNDNCSDIHSTSKIFTTPNCYLETSGNPTFPVMAAIPNPGNAIVQLNFGATRDEIFTIIAIKQSNGQVIELLQNAAAESDGNTTVNVNTDILDAGLYTILSLGTVNNYFCHWIKL